MAITDLDKLLVALARSPECPYNKASIGTQVIGTWSSLWKATGYPQIGSTPTTLQICNAASTGAMPLPARTGAQERILAGWDVSCATAFQTVILEDRLIHLGNLSGTSIISQACIVDASVTGSNLVQRIGAADYSELRWWFEWYGSTGSTAVNATINVTYNDNSTGDIVVAIPASTAISRKIEIVGNSSLYIKQTNAVILSASTLTAGNFGITVTRTHARAPIALGNKFETLDWSMLKARLIPDNACLQFSMFTIATSTGIIHGGLYMAVE